MASFTNKIAVILEVAGDNAKAGLRSFKTSINEADGASGKLKAGWKSTGDFVASHAAAFALSAGSALVGFGLKAVGAFQDSALAAGQLGDSLGIAYDDASRWIEIAGDMGTSADTIEKTMGKLETQVGKNSEKLKAYGVDTAYAKDGSIDANETFLRTIEMLGAIEDPGKRAAAAQDLLGKSWRDMAEIIESKDIRGALQGVSDAKVFDAEDVAEARRFRDQVDELKGRFEDVTNEVGKGLVPAISDAIEKVDEMITSIGKIPGMPKVVDSLVDVIKISGDALIPFDNIKSGIERMTDDGSGNVERLAGVLETLGGPLPIIDEGIQEINKRIFDGIPLTDDFTTNVTALVLAAKGIDPVTGEAADGVEDLGDEFKATKKELTNFADEWDRLDDKFSDESTTNAMVDAFDEIKAAAIEAYGTGMKGTAEEAEDAQKSLRDATLSGKEAVSDYLREVLKVPASQATSIIADLEQGNLDEAWRKILELTAQKTLWIDPKIKPGNVIVGIDTQGAKAHAMGGRMSPGELGLVGEQGPELYVPDSAGVVIPAAQTAAMLSGGTGGGGVTIQSLNVYANSQSEGAIAGRAAVDAINAELRRRGRPTL